MKKRLIRLGVALALVGCVACGGPKQPTGATAPDPKAKMMQPKAPPALPKPPADAPRR
jgi:recombinational DNA repair protein (RecF pathway)